MNDYLIHSLRVLIKKCTCVCDAKDSWYSAVSQLKTNELVCISNVKISDVLPSSSTTPSPCIYDLATNFRLNNQPLGDIIINGQVTSCGFVCIPLKYFEISCDPNVICDVYLVNNKWTNKICFLKNVTDLFI